MSIGDPSKNHQGGSWDYKERVRDKGKQLRRVRDWIECILPSKIVHRHRRNKYKWRKIGIHPFLPTYLSTYLGRQTNINLDWVHFKDIFITSYLLPMCVRQLLGKWHYKGSGCGSVGRAVASNTRGQRFKSSHWQISIYTLNICFLTTVY